jgi:DNA polymerase-3 subunit epsilon
MEFVAIDVETANPSMSSICQIGVATYRDGVLVKEWQSLVDPEDYFDFMNVSIHGIDEEDVVGAPTFPQIAEELWLVLGNAVAVCHTHFDRVAISQASARYGVVPPNRQWLDSARVARRTWQDIAWRGYGLGPLCERLGYKFKHHNALEDAKAAGHVLLAAMQTSGRDLQGMLDRVTRPIDPTSRAKSVARDGNPEGPLCGEVVVFTGALDIPRKEAADLAASIGCTVTPSVTKKTTLLIVGDQDVTKLAGHEKSSKHRKAEELIVSGASIRILKESDFKELVMLARAEA